MIWRISPHQPRTTRQDSQLRLCNQWTSHVNARLFWVRATDKSEGQPSWHWSRRSEDPTTSNRIGGQFHQLNHLSRLLQIEWLIAVAINRWTASCPFSDWLSRWIVKGLYSLETAVPSTIHKCWRTNLIAPISNMGWWVSRCVNTH